MLVHFTQERETSQKPQQGYPENGSLPLPITSIKQLISLSQSSCQVKPQQK